MRYVCEIPYREYPVNLRPLFEGGVSWKDWLVFADDPVIHVTGNAKPVAITLHREQRKSGSTDASAELSKFLMTLDWQKVA